MAAVYDKLGIRFMYPENWHVVYEQASQTPYEVSIQTPGGGFWSVGVYSSDSDPLELASETLRTMRGEYTDLESEEIIETVEDTEAVGYEMNFYCLDLIVTARVLGLRSARRTLLVLYQAESREFEEMAQVFRAITVSLQRGIKSS